MQKMDFIVFVCATHASFQWFFFLFVLRAACQCQLLHSKLLLAELNFRIDFWSSFFLGTCTFAFHERTENITYWFHREGIRPILRKQQIIDITNKMCWKDFRMHVFLLRFLCSGSLLSGALLQRPYIDCQESVTHQLPKYKWRNMHFGLILHRQQQCRRSCGSNHNPW